MLVFTISYFIGDAPFLWLAANLCLLWPLAYKMKRADIDRVVGLVNLKIDEIVYKIPLLKKLEQNRKVVFQPSGADSKKIQ